MLGSVASDTAPLVIGIDAGGTRTRAYLADGDGIVLGEGAGGPGNAMSVPRGELTRHLVAAIKAAVPADRRGAVRAVVGGFGAETDEETSTKSCMSRKPSDGFVSRSRPIVDDRSLLMLPPQSDPATWPG